jgi:hypothetical protein
MTDLMKKLPLAIETPLAVVCHDSGAANLIFAWLDAWNASDTLGKHEFRLHLMGPANSVWLANPVNLTHVKIYSDLHEALNGANCVLTGTGWSSSLEHDARKIAIDMQIPSIAVIDHWVNYEQRFKHHGEIILPDSIWVSDQYATSLAQSIFKNLKVFELPNTYLVNIVNKIPKIPKCTFNLLYVLEPLRNNWGKGIEGEFQALDFFAENIRSIVKKKRVNITLRPHPSDPPGKYTNWIKANSYLNVSLDQHETLNEAIAGSRWVVGAETFAMVVAITSGRSTWSSLPPWAHRCRLPQTGIKHLRDYV